MIRSVVDKNNFKLIRDVKHARLNPHFAVVLIIALLIIYVNNALSSLMMISFTGVTMILGGLNHNLIYSLQILILPYLTFLLLIYLWVRFVEGRRFSTLGLYTSSRSKGIAFGIIGGISLAIISVFSVILFSATVLTPASAINAPISFVLASSGLLLKGISEVIFTIGWLMPTISKRHGVFLGVLLTALFSVAFHAMSDGVSFILLLNSFVMSVLISLIALYHDSIWTSCFIKGSYNVILGSIFGISTNGSKFFGGSIFHLDAGGLRLISGGSYSVSGSFILTLILLISISVVTSKLKGKVITKSRANKKSAA